MADSYDALEEKKIDIKVISSFHVLKIIKNLNRRITFKEKFTNPWIIEIGEHIHFSAFFTNGSKQSVIAKLNLNEQ